MTSYNDPDAEDFKQINESGFQQICSKLSKIGYADGVGDGRDSTFQNGFDLGYKDGLKAGFELDKFKSFFVHVKASESDIFREKQKYFDIHSEDIDVEGLLINNKEFSSKCSAERQTHFDNVVKKIVGEIPKSFSLLNKP